MAVMDGPMLIHTACLVVFGIVQQDAEHLFCTSSKGWLSYCTTVIVKLILASIPDPSPSGEGMFRDWQGFTNPWGYCSRVVRVGVRVWIPQPFTYPYPLRRVLIPLKGKRRVQESRMYQESRTTDFKIGFQLCSFFSPTHSPTPLPLPLPSYTLTLTLPSCIPALSFYTLTLAHWFTDM
jgi:hypothetical protein